MPSYIFVSPGSDPGAGLALVDPMLSSSRPTMGTCRPDLRRMVRPGDHIFVISGSRGKSIPQYVIGGMQIDEKLEDQLEAAKAHAEFMSSPEGARKFELHWLRHSRLVLLLGEIAQKTPRADGWTVLACAGHIVRQREPKELEHMLERYGHRTLKKLLQATELFDIVDEPTPGGGTRTVYRINPRFDLQIQPEKPPGPDEGDMGGR